MQNPCKININFQTAVQMYFLQRTYSEVWAYLWAKVCLTSLGVQYACTSAYVLVVKYRRTCTLKCVWLHLECSTRVLGLKYLLWSIGVLVRWNVFDCTWSAVRVYLGVCTCSEVWAYLCVEVCLTALGVQYVCTLHMLKNEFKYGRAYVPVHTF